MPHGDLLVADLVHQHEPVMPGVVKPTGSRRECAPPDDLSQLWPRPCPLTGGRPMRDSKRRSRKQSAGQEAYRGSGHLYLRVPACCGGASLCGGHEGGPSCR